MSSACIQNWSKRSVGQSFADAAQSYDAVAQLQRQVGSALFERMNKAENRVGHHTATRSAPIILDVGAGTGFCSELFIRSNTWNSSQVVALDLAQGMLRQARTRLADTVYYLNADAEGIALVDDSVDLIFANLAVQWCTNLSAVFSEFVRILKPGGQVYFSSLGPKTLCELRAAWRSVDDAQHVNDFVDLDWVQTQLKNAGLNGVVETELIQLQYPTVMALMRELKALGARNLNQNRHSGLMGKQRLQQVCDAYQQLVNGAQIHASYEVFYATTSLT